jgi:hypothetical protein
MSKVIFLFIFIGSSILYSQSTNSSINKVKFEDDSLDLNFSHFEPNKISFYFSKLETPFSIYNPMPGLNISNINSQNYYSMDNTNRLLGNEMKLIKKDPVFLEIKKETLGEVLFSRIFDSIFDQ